MKSSLVWLLTAVLAVGVLMMVAFQAGGSPEKPGVPGAATPPATSLPAADQAASKPEPVTAPVSKLVPDDAPREVLLEAINDVAITYDPVELPKIKPYLLHPDAEVRKAALDGMVVLGDAAASPMLRDAARQVTSTKEAIELMQAAEYLELPSATGLLKSGTTKAETGPRKGGMPR
ncbi:HEAT repeat domain-containing protein [Prosthecobacter algae]